MENTMSVADYLAVSDRRGYGYGDGVGMFGGNGGFLWIILIFLFFLAFSGGRGLFGNNCEGSVQLSQMERDILNGNCATQKEVLESRYTTQLAAQNLQAQMAQCCCETQKDIAALSAQSYRNTCEITNAVHAEGEATRALITSNTIQDLRDRLGLANNALTSQTLANDIVSAVRPTPIPAYITCSPYANGLYGGYNGFGWGYNNFNNCGCNGLGTSSLV